MRHCPSTMDVNEPLAFIWSLPRALANIVWRRALPSLAETLSCLPASFKAFSMSLAVVWSYQMSSSRISE